MAPPATQRAAFQEHRGPNPGTIVQAIPLDMTDTTAFHTSPAKIPFSPSTVNGIPGRVIKNRLKQIHLCGIIPP
jgi:hypothetical protein